MKATLFRAASMISLLPCGGLQGETDQTTYVEHSKPTARTLPGLGTTYYRPSPAEVKATKGWSEKELKSGSPDTATLQGAIGRRVAWFGIVREVIEDKSKHETRLRVEMKYFDGFTDLHLQIVSIFGAGDFEVVIPGTGQQIKKLSLVRVCGNVTSERDRLPIISARFVRVWDWRLFAFMPYGKDKSDAKWIKLRKVDKDEIYSSEPDDQYYEQRLGLR